MEPIRETDPVTQDRVETGGGGLLRAGRIAWALLGLAGLLVIGWLVAFRLAVVVVPLVLALFPAAVLSPVVDRLARHRVPRPLAAAAVVLLTLGVVGAVLSVIVPAFRAKLPELAQSLTQGGSRLDELVDRLPSVDRGTSLSDLAGQLLQFVGGFGTIVSTTVTVLAATVLLVVLLLCYLTVGRRMAATGIGLLPVRWRADAAELGAQLWHTLGSYFRALFLVAVFDSVSIGTGLWLLGVPLVLPLSVLVFIGAFFPYIGALVTGLLAILVALASGGLGTALAVLVLVLVVQQIEGNVLQPLLVGHIVRLSAVVVIVAIATGATLLGVLGAFLAVPVAACLARVVTFAREPRAATEEPGSTVEDPAAPSARDASPGE